jgi:hypothetical protein
VQLSPEEEEEEDDKSVREAKGDLAVLKVTCLGDKACVLVDIVL